MISRRVFVAVLVGPIVFAACSTSDDPSPATATATATASVARDAEAESSDLQSRVDEIDAAVAAWRGAASLAEAQVAAEAAANLVVGPNGPDYGDRNGDGTIDGENDAGILPGLEGAPEGLALPLVANPCIESNVLGGSWDDPAGRWATMNQAIDDWTDTNNTMPSLPSHPMRVVGWSTFTIATDALDDAQEYAGHAQLHVDITRDALAC